MFWATVIVCLVTVVATFINYLLLRSQTDPEIIIYTKHDLRRSTIITLVIENIGKSVAYNITFRLSKQIPKHAFGWKEIQEGDIEWMNSGPLVNGIPSLPPGGSRELDWGQFVGLKSIIGDQPILITAQYEAKKLLSYRPVKCETDSKVDIESYAGTVAHDDNEPKKIREELEKIHKALNQIGSKRQPLNIQIARSRVDQKHEKEAGFSRLILP